MREGGCFRDASNNKSAYHVNVELMNCICSESCIQRFCACFKISLIFTYLSESKGQNWIYIFTYLSESKGQNWIYIFIYLSESKGQNWIYMEDILIITLCWVFINDFFEICRYKISKRTLMKVKHMYVLSPLSIMVWLALLTNER